MSRYPDTVQFNRLNRPIGVEWTARNLEVQGEIPAEIRGAFFRAVPDPAHPPRDPMDIALSGDGMVSRFLIENGKIGPAVKGATLIGSGPDVLTKVSMIGNDMKLDDGIGTCGKDGQGVPVGVGQPTLKIAGLTVGGTQA